MSDKDQMQGKNDTKTSTTSILKQEDLPGFLKNTQLTCQNKATTSKILENGAAC